MRHPVDEEQVLLALAWIKVNPKSNSIRGAAERYALSKSTIHRHLHGGRSAAEVNEEKTVLFTEEEIGLRDAAFGHSDRGFPIHIFIIRLWGNSVLASRLFKRPLHPNQDLLGVNWPARFILRHPGLEHRWHQTIDRVRVKAATPESQVEFIKTVKQVRDEYNIPTGGTFNVDEKGILLGQFKKAQVLARAGDRGFRTQDGNRENVTVLEFIDDAGNSYKPLYIFKGQRLQRSWVENDPIGAYYATSETGWTNNVLGTNWIERVFDPQTRHLFPGRNRLIILDGHASHLSLEFVDYARENNIILLCLPAHATATLQPLDVGIFGPLSKYWSNVLQENLVGGLNMRKQDFCTFYAQARGRVLTPENIRSSFEATGITPWNPDRVQIHNEAPRLGYKDGEIPIPPPEIVRANVALAQTQSAEARARFDVFQEVEGAVRIRPTTQREKILHRAVLVARENALQSNTREIITAERAQAIEEKSAARKDGSKRRLQLGGQVVTSDEVRAEIKAKDDELKAKAARKRSKGRGKRRVEVAVSEPEDAEDGSGGEEVSHPQPEHSEPCEDDEVPPHVESIAPPRRKRPRPRPRPRR